MNELPSEDARRWGAFGRRLMLAFSLLTVLLGGGSALVATLRVRAMLENALAESGRAVASAAARSAYVPLILEDRDALDLVASNYEGQASLASLRILDERGVEWARYFRPGAKPEDLITQTASISAPGEASEKVGTVEVHMDAGGVREALARQAAVILFFNALFAFAILLSGLFIIRRLTLGMRELARQAERAEELSRSNRELEDFAYVASHDLQAPLRRIAGFTQLLSKRYARKLGPEADEFIERITAGAEKMQSLIQDLLAYSRAGSRQLQPVPTDLDAVLREVLADLDPAIKDADGRVIADRLPVMTVDPGQAARLLQNLIGNAIKFHGPLPPEVRIAARRAAGEWVFSVSDNGIGIEPRFTQDVFKMFRRLHGAAAYPGTGIGLAVARKIVERHGGRIWIESKPGKGSTFYFTLGASPEPDKEKRHG